MAQVYTQPQSAVIQAPYATYQPGNGASPIVIQPGAPQLPACWVQIPAISLPNCPPGLEFLHGRDKIVIKERQTTMEVLVGIELPNMYSIQTPTGEQIYCMAEEPRYLQAEVMGGHRGYKMQVIDGYRRVAFTIRRPLQCCANSACACCSCCQRVSKVEGSGMVFGSMHTRMSCWSTALSIQDELGKDIIYIDGPCCCSYCCSSADFVLKSAINGSVVGHIKRKWKGCLRSAFTKMNEFHIEFPADMDVRSKANIIGACIMIDFEQFENTEHNRHNGQR
ncbi:hypothetical protein PRIPAC_84280 [Pristionchus pacificus]|nr:hypothetical protein PRIPAC_84280 [Pristionchus pacificus]